MSDNIPPSMYSIFPNDQFAELFRRRVMHLFMDDLELEQVEKLFFICKMPQRLRDKEDKFRFEVLTYAEQQLLDEWIQTPSLLQNLLEEVGRTDMSVKIQKLVGKSVQILSTDLACGVMKSWSVRLRSKYKLLCETIICNVVMHSDNQSSPWDHPVLFLGVAKICAGLDSTM